MQPGELYHIHASASRVVFEGAQPPPVSLSVLYAHNVDLDIEDEWEFLNILLSDEDDVRSSLLVDFTVNSDKCVEYSVEAPTTAASVKLARRALNTLGEQQELLTGVNWFCRSI